MPLDYTYQEVIHSKVSHFELKGQELMGSCVICYSLVVIYGGADWITSIRGLVGMEWGSTAEETRDSAR
jgi:hypothetical protein